MVVMSPTDTLQLYLSRNLSSAVRRRYFMSRDAMVNVKLSAECLYGPRYLFASIITW